MAQQHISTNTFGCAKWIVSPNIWEGTHTTIQAAINAASSGDTIFLRPSTYAENPTLKAGVCLTAYDCDSSSNGTGNVIISGELGFSGSGSVTITGIQLQTNGAAFLNVSGANASIVNLDNCFLNITNSTGILNSSTDSSSAINISDTNGNITAPGNAVFNHTGNGSIFFYNTDFQNTGGSSTASTISAGTFFSRRSFFATPLTTSGTATGSSTFCQWDTSAQNATACTFGGSGGHTWLYTQFQSGTATALVVNNTSVISDAFVSSSNLAAISGAGTMKYAFISFGDSSSAVTVATKTPLATLI